MMENQQNKQNNIGEESLTEKLQYACTYARTYTSMTDSINRCHENVQLNKQEVWKHWKWRLIICGASLYATLAAIFAGMDGEKLLAIPLIALIVFVWKYKGKKIKQCNNNIANDERFINVQQADLDDFANENGYLIEFIPQEYWNIGAIEYFYNAVSTGTANDLNQAIQQYNTYQQQQYAAQMQQTIYEQGIQMQQQIDNLRNTIFRQMD